MCVTGLSLGLVRGPLSLWRPGDSRADVDLTVCHGPRPLHVLCGNARHHRDDDLRDHVVLLKDEMKRPEVRDLQRDLSGPRGVDGGSGQVPRRPVRALVLFPSMKQMRFAPSSGVPTTSFVCHSRKPPGFTTTCLPR